MESARDRLKDIICDGVAIDILYAEEALALDELIGREADKINDATFGAFFGSLQRILGRELILAISRIFEREGDRYKVRSIPAAIKVLREHADKLAVEQRPALIESLQKCGLDPQELGKTPDRELTRIVADYFAETMPRAGLQESESFSKGLNALKTLRDKFIAHPEAVKLENLPRATFHEIDQLLEFAMFFVSTVGFAYLSTVYADDRGDYLLSVDATRAARCLERVLQAAGVLEKPTCT